MLVTFLRHATAELYTDSATDFERALKKKGKDQVVKVAAFCRRNALLPSVLCSSPAKRAQQTAQLLHTRLPDCPQVQTVDWLGLDADAAKLYSALQQLCASGVDDVWMVGHEPTISQTLALLLNAPGLDLVIKKASLTRVQVDFSNPVAGQLLWTVPCALMG